MFYRTDEEIRFGNKYYKRFEDLLDDYSSLSTLSPPSFNEVFGGTIQHKNQFGQLLYVKDGEITTDATGSPYMYPNIATANQVWTLFLMLYEDSYCGVPYKTTTRDSDYERFSYNLQDKISRFNLMNGDKYRRILDSYFFDYDPISNYDMIEEGLDTNTPTGTESMTHSIVGEIDYTELRGPATSSTAIDFSRKKETSITDNSSTSGSNSISYNSSTANSGGIAETLNQKSGSQNKSGGILQVSGNSISINGNGTMPTTTHFTTTFDSADENETGSDVTKGDAASLDATVSSRSTTDTTSTAHHGSDTTTIGSNSNSTNTTKEDIIPELRIVKGNSEPGYSDVKTFGNRKDEQSHKLTRKGNIGVTTSQQMIQSERELYKDVLLKDYLKDLANYITLGIY